MTLGEVRQALRAAIRALENDLDFAAASVLRSIMAKSVSGADEETVEIFVLHDSATGLLGEGAVSGFFAGAAVEVEQLPGPGPFGVETAETVPATTVAPGTVSVGEMGRVVVEAAAYLPRRVTRRIGQMSLDELEQFLRVNGTDALLQSRTGRDLATRICALLGTTPLRRPRRGGDGSAP